MSRARRAGRAFVLSLSALAFFGPTGVGAQGRRLEAIERGEAEITIDGRLDEARWADAPVADDFVERFPNPGRRPPVRTSVRALYDDNAIYFAIVAELLPGESPRALELARDSTEIWEDDALTLKIDARGDARTTLGLTVNAAGAQLDYLALDNGRVLRREFDAVWESAVHVEEDRWIAEVRVPAFALGLSEGQGPRGIGLQVTRDHNARAATYDWSPMPPEFGPFSALHYGRLEGLGEIGGGIPITLTPYALGALRAPDGVDHHPDGLVGGEVQLRLGADVWAELSILTDFAQVDLDDALVNLDRFPLFFPERRPFFLNGLDVFDFGVAGQVQPFFTRRIGLDERGGPVPVLGGLKVWGREGPVAFGILDVLTDGVDGQPMLNHTVARTRISLDGRASYVGAILVSRQPISLDDPASAEHALHATLGVDGLVRTLNDRFEISGFAARTGRSEPDVSGRARGDGVSGQVAARYLGEVFQPALSALMVEDSFAPDVGFVRRPGATRARLDLPAVIRPGNALRRLTLQPSGELQTGHRLDELLLLEGRMDIEADLGEGFVLGAGASYREDRVEEDFFLLGALQVPTGLYRGAILDVRVATPEARNPQGSLRYAVSNAFFGGVQHQLQGRAEVRFDRWVYLLAGADVFHGWLPESEPFWTYAVNGLLRVTPDTAWQIDLLARVDGPRELITGLLRIRWRYAPGSDIFFVYREDVLYGGDEGPRFARSLTLKALYRFDALL